MPWPNSLPSYTNETRDSTSSRKEDRQNHDKNTDTATARSRHNHEHRKKHWRVKWDPGLLAGQSRAWGLVKRDGACACIGSRASSGSAGTKPDLRTPAAHIFTKPGSIIYSRYQIARLHAVAARHGKLQVQLKLELQLELQLIQLIRIQGCQYQTLILKNRSSTSTPSKEDYSKPEECRHALVFNHQSRNDYALIDFLRRYSSKAGPGECRGQIVLHPISQARKCSQG